MARYNVSKYIHVRGVGRNFSRGSNSSRGGGVWIFFSHIFYFWETFKFFPIQISILEGGFGPLRPLTDYAPIIHVEDIINSRTCMCDEI